DVAANMAMLGDPESARFITADRKPVTEPMAGWRNAAIMAGHRGPPGVRVVVGGGKGNGEIVRPARPRLPPGGARLRGRLGHCRGIPRQGLRGGSGAGLDRLVVRDLCA